jgi:cysteine desulfurase / selenocysteine lyase
MSGHGVVNTLESAPIFVAKLGDRSLFPKLEARAYLNHGGISPPSFPVERAIAAVLDDYAHRGAAAFLRWHEQRQRLKGKLGALIGVSGADIALVPNTTRGVIDIALCFPWKPGDRIVLFEGEFPANVTPWQRAAATFGAEIIFLPLSEWLAGEEQGMATLARELDRGVRLVAVSAVEFQTGLRMPLRAIAERCHSHGAEIFVDAVQACGAVPFDAGADDVDYVACGSHKWMMGLEGCGFLYARPDRAAALRPTTAGWLSHEEGLRFLFEGPGHLRYDRSIRKSIDFLEGGNYNTAGLAGLEASLDLIQHLGVPAIHAHVNGYLDELEPALVARGFESLRSPDPRRRSCTLGVRPPAGVSVVDLHRGLEQRRIACALPDGVLRFTPHWPNNASEIPFVLDAVDETLAALPRG